MRKWVLLVLACLLVGAALNVLVAWTLTLLSKFPDSSRATASYYGPLTWPRLVPDNWPSTGVYWRCRTDGLDYQRWVATTGTRHTYLIDRVTLGWPWPSLSASIVRETTYSPAGDRWLLSENDYSVWVRGLRAPESLLRQQAPACRAFPLRPRWWPFVASSLVFALPLVLVAVGWPLARQQMRVRAGRCSECGYDRAGIPRDTACPECGGLIDASADARPDTPPP